MEFATPVFLVVGALACAALVWREVRVARRRQRDLDRFVAPALQSELLSSVSVGRRRLKSFLRVAAVALVFLALARPQLGYRFEEIPRRGVDVLLALDTSKSMLAGDVAPDRLTRAKIAIQDFVARLGGDRVGLIPFAGQAFVTCPLTLDHDAFLESLAAVDVDIIPEGGTDLAAAIRQADAALDESGTQDKVLLLITDGEDLEGEALAAAETAAAGGLTIHTVGVGTPAGELIPLVGARGDGSLLRDEAGQPVRSQLDEAGLSRIAAATGGVYQPLGRHGEGLTAIHRDHLAQLTKRDFSERRQRVPLERFEWPLGLAVLLLLAEFVIGDRRRRRAKARLRVVASRGSDSVARFRRMGPAALILVSAMALAQGAAAQEGTRPALPEDPRQVFNRAVEDYSAGRFEAAAETFRAALRSEDTKLHGEVYYSLGNSLFRQGEAAQEGSADAALAKWEEAVRQYDLALELEPEDGDARFNRGVVARKIEGLRKQQEQEQQEQQQQQQGEQEQPQEQEQQQNAGEQPQEQQGGGGDSPQEKTDQEQSGSEGSDSGQKPEGGEDASKPDPQSGSASEGDGEESKPEPKASGDPEGASGAGEERKGDAAGAPKPEPEPGTESQQGEGNEAQPRDGNEPGEGELVPINEAGDAEGEPSDDAPARAGVMSRRQAEHLLESLKNDEGQLRFVPVRQQADPRGRSASKKKDW